MGSKQPFRAKQKSSPTSLTPRNQTQALLLPAPRGVNAEHVSHTCAHRDRPHRQAQGLSCSSQAHKSHYGAALVAGRGQGTQTPGGHWPTHPLNLLSRSPCIGRLTAKALLLWQSHTHSYTLSQLPFLKLCIPLSYFPSPLTPRAGLETSLGENWGWSVTWFIVFSPPSLSLSSSPSFSFTGTIMKCSLLPELC